MVVPPLPLRGMNLLIVTLLALLRGLDADRAPQADAAWLAVTRQLLPDGAKYWGANIALSHM